MVTKYLPLPVSVTVSQWQNVGHRLIKGTRSSVTILAFHSRPNYAPNLHRATLC